MTDEQRDPKVSQRYRELGEEEPSSALDASIRAAARRAAETRPAPLVAPTGRRRWYFPVAAAAIIVLVVAVTAQIERQQPDPEALTFKEETAKQEQAAKEESKPAEKPVPRRFARDPESAVQQAPGVAASPPSDNRAERERKLAEERSAAGALSRAPEAPAQRSLDESRERADSAPGAKAFGGAPAAQPEMRAQARKVEEPPERWLERIAELRKQGRDEEADRQLAEFRKRYPGYRIPETMLEKVEKR